MYIYQGDQYAIFDNLTIDGMAIKLEEIDKILFSIGALEKYYPNDVVFEENLFKIYLTQEETYKMQGLIPYQVMVKFTNNDVYHSDIKNIVFEKSISKVVLE